jgi:hypothetical protein
MDGRQGTARCGSSEELKAHLFTKTKTPVGHQSAFFVRQKLGKMPPSSSRVTIALAPMSDIEDIRITNFCRNGLP